MRFRSATIFSGLLVALAAPGAGAAVKAAPPARLVVTPSTVRLVGRHASQALAVTAIAADGTETDVSAKTKILVPAGLGSLDEGPVLFGERDGKGSLQFSFGGKSLRVPLEVKGTTAPPAYQFERDIQPILTKSGCNQGACHGKAIGQHGFKLSLLGWDYEADWSAIAREGGARRVSKTDPGHSLLLLKAASVIPHGGGKRIAVGSPDFRILQEWIGAGAPFGEADAPRLQSISVWPRSRVARKGGTDRLLVTAHYSDGSQRDVTGRALYTSNDLSMATVDESGTVSVERTGGEAPVMVRYCGVADIARVVVPAPAPKTPYTPVPTTNLIDEAIFRKLRTLNIEPSRLTTDTEFLRRVTEDVTGRLPTPDEIRTFVADTAADKRSRKIDELLDSAAYADWWTLTWSDLLQVRQYYDNEDKLTQPFYNWVHQAISENMPFDRFASSVVAAIGSSHQHGPADYYHRLGNTGITTTTYMAQLTQVFMGVRIQCAQCHHHPYDKWSQDDYWGMASFFQRLQVRNQESVVLTESADLAQNPRTGKKLKPTPLGAPAFEPVVEIDPRQQLADWLTGPDNPYFGRALANRLWSHFFGRGLVDPVDDMRVTNPASYPELLDGLAHEVSSHGYDLKHLMRVILNSRAYQLASATTPSNEADLVLCSHGLERRLNAEALMDAITDATGTIQRFSGAPYGMRATQLPDQLLSTDFLKMFGRPARDTPCECERKNENSVPIALHMMNGNTISEKLGDGKGRLARLLKSGQADDAILDELFLATLSRWPSGSERTAAKNALAKVEKPDARREVYEDILWALMNSREFMFNL